LFLVLAFVVLVVGAYLANAVDATSQRPAIGLAALAAFALALASWRAERQTRQRIEELTETRRRDAWRMRSELDEAHARSHRALERAVAAESAVQTLMAATESLLAVRHALLAAAAAPATVVAPPAPVAAPVVAPAPVVTPTPVAAPAPVLPQAPPTTPPLRVPAPVQPAAAAFTPTFVPTSVPTPAAAPAPAPVAPAAAAAMAPAAALTPPTLVWPLADLPAQQREPSLDLPLIPAPGGRVAPRFVPVESPRGVVSSMSASGAGTEPIPASELVDITSTSTTRYARPA
jgi:hypothetical protein